MFKTHLVTQKDQSEWRELFEGYAAFYNTPISDETADAVWHWLLDPQHVLEGLIVRDQRQVAVGFLHVRACPRPLGGCDIGFADDMYVLPAARGTGASDALFQEMHRLAAVRGWQAVRWITQHFNGRGRSFYDRYTDGPSDFIVYQWNLKPLT